MNVTLIAATVPVTRPRADLDKWEDALDVVEFAGRTCYLSYDKPNPATADQDGYLRNIISQQHYSVLEHASVSFYVTGVSRSLLAELTRHRHLSFSVQSQRFVNEAYDAVVPPALAHDQEGRGMMMAAYAVAWDKYVTLRQHLLDAGLPRKQANEAARSVLPNAQGTTLVVTGNLRSWREVIVKRHSPHADAEIRHFAHEVLFQLDSLYPAVFVDLW